MRKPSSYAEIYNDLDGHVVNVFRVLRDPVTAERLRLAIELTPFSRTEFVDAHEVTDDPVEEARRVIIRSFMGFGSDSTVRRNVTGFRANSNRSGTTPAHDWRNYPVQIAAFVDRLRGVVIENRPAADLIERFDSPETLFYVDPPYVTSTRGSSKRHGYMHEMDDADHRQLAEQLQNVRGSVILSGYACELYDVELYRGWDRIEKATHADGARKRTEVLWMNHSATRQQQRLIA